MAYFLVKHEGEIYANTDLYYRAVAGGERSFMKMLAERLVSGKTILDQILYPVTKEQRKLCESYNPKFQDVDKDLDALREADEGFDGRVITVPKALAPKLVEHKGFTFLKIRDLNQPEKYRLLPKLATTRVCACSYVALRAVSEGVESPIVVTVSK
jgi:hypothetical protein